MEKQLSTEIATHEIHYKDGKDSAKSVKVYESEAAEALKKWEAWRPVPVPNTKDARRSCMVLNPASIIIIKRFRYA